MNRVVHMCWPLTFWKWGMQFTSIHWYFTIIFNHESTLQYLRFKNNKWKYIYIKFISIFFVPKTTIHDAPTLKEDMVPIQLDHRYYS
jgi:hypothetical protein